MPNSYNVQLSSTRFYHVSNLLLSFSPNVIVMRRGGPHNRTWPHHTASSAATASTTTGCLKYTNVNQLMRWPPSNQLLQPPAPLYLGPIFSTPLFMPVHNYMSSSSMRKAQELPYPMPERPKDDFVPTNSSRLKRSSSSSRDSESANEQPTTAADGANMACPDLGHAHTEEAIGSVVSSVRQWELTEVGVRQSRERQQGLELTVLSYNVLAQCLLEDNYYLYRRCQPDYLQWDYRKARILKELAHLAADVICLQEVEQDHFNSFFVPELNKLGYSGVYKKRTGDKNDGCAIFYKRKSLQLLQLRSVEFCKPGVQLLDRDNVAMVAMLQPTKPSASFGGQVCVANTHLLFNPGRGDIKLAQLKILLAEIDQLAFRRFTHTGRPIYHPVLMCGDFNSEPHCYLYRFLSKGNLHYEGLTAGDISGQSEGVYRGRFQLPKEVFPPNMGISNGCQYLDTLRMRGGGGGSSPGEDEIHQRDPPTGRMSHRLNLVSAYKHRVHRASTYQREVTTNQNRTGCTVDYIFYSVQHKKSVIVDQQVVHRDVRESSLRLMATYSLLTDTELQSIGHMPNAALPSDHLPLAAKFLLKDS